MNKPFVPSPGNLLDRRALKPVVAVKSAVAGVLTRQGDVETARGIHSAAILFRVMAGLVTLVLVLQVFSGLAGLVEISYGTLTAEVMRLTIAAGLLWAAGDLVDMFVKSHRDLRATRILLERLGPLLAPQLDVRSLGLPPIDSARETFSEATGAAAGRA